MGYRKAHCLFEQSGIFKNEFIKLGISAEDYDIRNDFGQTDNVIDLFNEIHRGGGQGEPCIFDDFTEDDIVLAFFPCTLFQENNVLLFNGHASQFKNYTDEQKLRYVIDRHKQLNEMYTLLSELCLIALERGLKLVVENPAMPPHYLNLYWPMEPSLIDKDRRDDGDYYKKPTQYWFFNCKPKSNLVFEPLQDTGKTWIVNKQKSSDGISRQVKRSMIHPQYARRFIMRYLL